MERVQTARHPERPYTLDLLSTIFEDFVELHGDRRYADDPAMVCGLARLENFEVAVVGQQTEKGAICPLFLPQNLETAHSPEFLIPQFYSLRFGNFQ